MALEIRAAPARKHLSARELDSLALSGEIDALLADAENRDLFLLQEHGDTFRRLAQALRSTKLSTPQFILWLLRRILIHDSQFLLRCQVYINSRLNPYLSRYETPPQEELPPDIANVWLPRLERIEDRLLRTALTYAKLNRQLGDAGADAPEENEEAALEEIDTEIAPEAGGAA